MVVLDILAIALLSYAALHDLAARTVPNWLPLCIAAVGCLARLADHSLLAALGIAGGTFLILFGIWTAGAVGGGDVKLWAATALLITPQWQPEINFFLRVVMFGGSLAVAYLVLWLCLPKRTSRKGGLASPREGGLLRPREGGLLRPREGGLLRRVLRAEAWRIGRRGPVPYAFAIAGGAIVALLPSSLQVLR